MTDAAPASASWPSSASSSAAAAVPQSSLGKRKRADESAAAADALLQFARASHSDSPPPASKKLKLASPGVPVSASSQSPAGLSSAPSASFSLSVSLLPPSAKFSLSAAPSSPAYSKVGDSSLGPLPRDREPAVLPPSPSPTSG